MSRKTVKDYYVGLDLGTNSVGWAVTDSKYNLLQFRKRDMWGARIFDEAQTAETRRTYRIRRRQYVKVKRRIQLLQELFAEEIAKIDNEFFLRLKESRYHPEDKKTVSRFGLFNDKDFSDVEYYDNYPTIYHLRSKLLHDSEKPDIRELYLALHHIIKTRGHFLFEGKKLENVKDFTQIYRTFLDYLTESMGFELPEINQEELVDILLDKSMNRKTKKNALNRLFKTKNTQLKGVLSLMVGSDVKLSKLYDNKDLDDEEKSVISFRTVAYDEERDTYASILNEDIYLLDIVKGIYDWVILTEILGDFEFFSDAKIAVYDKHKEDLSCLKYFIKNYGQEGEYTNCFRSDEIKDNYVSYVSANLSGNRKKIVHGKMHCNQGDVNKFFAKIWETISPNSEDWSAYEYMAERLARREALPKLRTSENRVVPYQVHQMELEGILDRAALHYPFLSVKDVNGLSTREKIVKIFKFRVPYYVGPLMPYYAENEAPDGNHWMVRNPGEEHTEINPWNFEQVVDQQASAEKFIRRMTNKCTYLSGEDVEPKDGILFSSFKALNELNNVRINGKPLPTDLKQEVFEQLFKTNRNVGMKKFRSFLKKKGMEGIDDAVIGGIDGKFQSSMTSYIMLNKVLDFKLTYEPYRRIAEDCIRWKCLYGENEQIFRIKLEKVYGKELTKEQILQLSRKKFNGWSPFSEKFLTGIQGIDRETGEVIGSIMDGLYKTQNNLMQLLSGRYTYADEIEKYNQLNSKEIGVSYNALMTDAYISPAVKRTVWQALTIMEEVQKIQKGAPKKVFLEMTRSDEKKERKLSRKTQLLELYKACKADSYLTESLSEHTDEQLRGKRLYLYYTQMGRCMYTGECIELGDVLSGQKYDTDHIFPRSLTKDDSLDNLVLVKNTVNQDKSDDYPLGEEIRRRMAGMWYDLHKKGLISDKKYQRLMRNTPLTDEELSGFISRQLVETSQSAKAVADIVKRIYPETEIAYIKAKIVSDFRKDMQLFKVRAMNDCHHAHDAYLNIVAGDIYHQRFTSNPYTFIKKARKEKKRPYNLYKFFQDIISIRRRDGIDVLWDPHTDMQKIRETLGRRTALVTEMPYEQRGKLFELTLVPKTDKPSRLMTPLKGSDERLHDFSKYGGYGELKGAYFILVEHKKGKKCLRTLEQVMLLYAKRIKTEADLLSYCEDVLGLNEPKILNQKIKLKSLIIYDGFPARITGRTGSYILLKNNLQLYLSSEGEETLRLVSLTKKNMADKGDYIDERLDHQRLMSLYEEFLYILTEGAFRKRPNSPEKLLEMSREVFSGLTMANKVTALSEIKKSMETSSRTFDLSLLGGKKDMGKMTRRKNITKANVRIVHESPTGLFRKYETLNKV